MSDSRLLDLSVGDFTRRLASAEPTPGGGSAAALAAALGAALLSMVAALTRGRPRYAEHEQELTEIELAAAALLADLLSLVDADAAAYDQVVAARRTAATEARAEELRVVLLRGAVADATRVPLRTAECAADLVALAERLARVGNRTALSDVEIAADLALTGLRGGLANVRANLPALPDDDPLPGELAPRIAAVEAVAERGADGVRAALGARDESRGSAALAAANEPTA